MINTEYTQKQYNQALLDMLLAHMWRTGKADKLLRQARKRNTVRDIALIVAGSSLWSLLLCYVGNMVTM